MSEQMKITRALLSVSDKKGLEDLAKALHGRGIEILASGGTGKALAAANIPYTEVSRFTGNPEAFDGRMKTLSFRLESALLFDRRDAKHVKEAKDLGIPPIDLVVCNFYPFEKAVARGAGYEELVSEIDVGGPTMVRAAAKNHAAVTVVVDPSDYAMLISELSARGGSTSEAFRRQMMVKAFKHVLDYDAAIYQAFAAVSGPATAAPGDGKALRYGENPHQKAVFVPSAEAGAVDWTPLGEPGLELSYNNILDAEAAFGALRDLTRLFPDLPSCVIVKHQNPCGVAVSGDGKLKRALERAWACDSTSAFGGIAAFSKPLDAETAAFLTDRFVEVLLAPGFSDGARQILAKKKNLRLLRINSFALPRPPVVVRVEGGLLQQDADEELDPEFQCVTKAPFSSQQRDLARFASVCAKWVKSNAIALVRRPSEGGFQMIGMGSGQPNRVDAIRRLAIPKAEKALAEMGEKLSDVLPQAILASDAFFPFPDSIEETAAAGVRMIIQPGGSKRDGEVIAAADKLGVAMAMTGRRHFRH